MPHSREEQEFFNAIGDLVSEVMLVRTGDSTERRARELLEEVFARMHALPVRGHETPAGVRFAVYEGGNEVVTGAPFGGGGDDDSAA